MVGAGAAGLPSIKACLEEGLEVSHFFAFLSTISCDQSEQNNRKSQLNMFFILAKQNEKEGNIFKKMEICIGGMLRENG